MIAIAWIVAQAFAASPPACSGPDITIKNVRFSTVRGSASTPDRVVIAADLVNVGTQSQTAPLAQHIELVHDGRVLVKEKVRALRVNEHYLVALRLFRQPNERKEPLEVMVRYVPDDPRARGENCATANDTIQKIF